jgi:hypothetical protein
MEKWMVITHWQWIYLQYYPHGDMFENNLNADHCQAFTIFLFFENPGTAIDIAWSCGKPQLSKIIWGSSSVGEGRPSQDTVPAISQAPVES